MDGLIEGRICHFVLPEGPRAGEHRPAVVVKVWPEHPVAGQLVNLQVFLDGTNDGLDSTGLVNPALVWVTSVKHDPTGAPRTWHWIEGSPGSAEQIEANKDLTEELVHATNEKVGVTVAG